MKKVLIATAILSFSVAAIAQTKYRMHSCEKNIKCTDKEALVLSFRVDPSGDKVLFQVHQNGSISSTSLMGADDCKVFDNLNWYCRPLSAVDGLPLYEYRMENGNLSYERYRPAPGLKDSRKKYVWAERL